MVVTFQSPLKTIMMKGRSSIHSLSWHSNNRLVVDDNDDDDDASSSSSSSRENKNNNNNNNNNKSKKERELEALIRGGDHLKILRFLRVNRMLRTPDLVLEHAKALMGQVATGLIPSPNDDELAQLGIYTVKRPSAEENEREEEYLSSPSFHHDNNSTCSDTLGGDDDDDDDDDQEEKQDVKRNSFTSVFSQPSLAGTSITTSPNYYSTTMNDKEEKDKLTFIPMTSIRTTTPCGGGGGDEEATSDITAERLDESATSYSPPPPPSSPKQQASDQDQQQEQQEYVVNKASADYAKLESRMDQMVYQQERTVQALGDLTNTMADLMREQTRMMMTMNNNNNNNNPKHSSCNEVAQEEEESINQDKLEVHRPEVESITVKNCDDDHHQKDHSKLEVDRATVRLDGLEVYAVVSALTVAMAISCFDLVSHVSSAANILTLEQMLDRDNIITLLLNMIYLITSGIGVIKGLHSTLVFSLMTMYGRTAVGISHDKAFVEFLTRTGRIRYRGFQSFRSSLYCFLIQVVFTICSHCPPLLRPFVVAIDLVAIWWVYQDTESVIKLAGEVLFPSSTKNKKDNNITNECQKSSSSSSLSSPMKGQRRKKRDSVKQTSSVPCSNLSVQEEEKEMDDKLAGPPVASAPPSETQGEVVFNFNNNIDDTPQSPQTPLPTTITTTATARRTTRRRRVSRRDSMSLRSASCNDLLSKGGGKKENKDEVATKSGSDDDDGNDLEDAIIKHLLKARRNGIYRQASKNQIQQQPSYSPNGRYSRKERLSSSTNSGRERGGKHRTSGLSKCAIDIDNFSARTRVCSGSRSLSPLRPAVTR